MLLYIFLEVCGVRHENSALLGGFFASARPLLAETRGRIVLLLHVCVLAGVESDQWDEWGVAAIAALHGLERAGVLPLDRAAYKQ